MKKNNKHIWSLVDKIADLVDKRHNEEFHINVDTARDMIYDMIQEYTNNIDYTQQYSGDDKWIFGPGT